MSLVGCGALIILIVLVIISLFVDWSQVKGFQGVTNVLKQRGESFLKDSRLRSYEEMPKRRWSNETGFYLGHNPNAGGVPD